MSKYVEISDDLQKQFNEIRDKQTSLPDYVEIKLLHDPKLKTIYKPIRASNVVQYLNQIDAFIFFNEDLLDMLDDESRKIAIEEALAYISYDSEKEVLSIAQPDLISFSGLVSKYNDKFFRYHEITKTLLQQKEDEAKDKKSKNKK